MLRTRGASQKEIEAWAREDGADEPIQDWDLAVTVEANASLIFRLASDDMCPHRWFFLSCLYLFVGDAVRTGFDAFPREFIERLISTARDNSPERVRRWATRARALVSSGSSEVDYADWCGGRLASLERLEGV
jgi:hypothetical protein